MRPFALLALAVCVAPAAAQPDSAVVRKLTSGGRERSYLLHVPKGIDPKAPAPVVVAFHGAAMTGRLMRAVTGLDATAGKHKFVVAYPDGTGLIQTWNAFPGAPAGKVDDVAFTRDLLDDLKSAVAVDPNRVYAAGFSNGGMLAYKLANELADRFAAVAAVGGTMMYDNPMPARPVPVIHFHGTEDGFVRYGGAKGMRSVDATAKAWAAANGCPPTFTDVEEPDADPADGCRVKRRTYGPGKDGAEVVVYTIEGGGHTWPGRPAAGGFLGRSTTDIDPNERMWAFFAKHARR